jgi:HK97 family phage major capsid protein
MPEGHAAGIQTVMEAITELRTTVEQVKSDGLDEAKLKTIEDFLEKQEDINQKITAEKLERDKKEAELKAQLDQVERLLSRPGAGQRADEQVRQEAKAFLNFVTKGEKEMGADEVKYLRTTSDTEGGFLVPTQYVPEIVKKITEISPIRQVARRRQTTAKEFEMPTRVSLLSVGWVGEGQQDTLSNSTYGLEKIPVHKMQVSIPITMEQLRDSAFDMKAEIFGDAQEAFAQKEGQAFVSGSAVKQPEGILTNGSVGYHAMGDASAITADGILDAQGQVKAGYNLSYLLNRKTLSKIRILRESSGRNYIWQPGMGAGMPAQIGGLPYLSVIDMPDIGAGAFPIALGDWGRAYVVVDNLNMETIRDPYTRKREGLVEFTLYRRVVGQVILPEAILKLKVATS